MSELQSEVRSWMQRRADEIERAASEQGVTRIVCASGISPSGAIHLGNLREVMTVHLMAEELKARGVDAVHLHSWDDYDRFRKVPAGIDESFRQHIGQPLSAVPDPYGCHDSYATHFMSAFTASLREMGVQMREVRQSLQYPAGVYNAPIRHALEHRERIFDILASFQTEGRHEKPLEQRRAEYYPYKPFCQVCGTDNTRVTAYSAPELTYTCRCGHTGVENLSDGAKIHGKLLWKVDWPMRWAYENVFFEPAGEDHQAPTSSFASGRIIAREIFETDAPTTLTYSFVGLSGGSSKMSGSAGGAATPHTALQIFEPAILRWLYARRTPGQSFSIDLAPRAVQRLYDEWDQFSERAHSDDATEADRNMYRTCTRTSVGTVHTTPIPVSFRLLSALADITQGNREQIGRLLSEHTDTSLSPEETLSSAEPRVTCAINFATELVPAEQRTLIADSFNTAVWEDLDDQTQRGVQMLAEHLDDAWDIDSLTKLVYGVPKKLLGVPEDTKPTPELKKAQRSFFAALYQLLCGKNTGPRLPTLLLSLGVERSRSLLQPPVAKV